MTSLLKDRASVEVSAARLARKQLDQAMELLESDRSGRLDEVVHAVRKRIKRTRALVKLVRDEVGKKAVAKVDRRLRDASRPLSTVRDASALLVALDQLERRSVGLVPDEPFVEARVLLEANKARLTREILEEGSALDQTQKWLKAARRRLNGWDLDGGRPEEIEGLGRAYRRGRTALRTALAKPSSEHLHELRKRVKALRFQLKVLGGNPSKAVARLTALAGLLASELGQGHDLDLLRATLEGHDFADPIVKALDRRRLDLRQGAIQRAGVIFQTRPKAFLKSLKIRECSVDSAQVTGN